MRKLTIVVALMLVSSLAFAQPDIVDMTLDSTTSGSHENIDQYVVDDILGVEVAQKDGWVDWLYWDPVMFTFGPLDLTNAAELQLDARFHQESYPDRPAYDDANIWILLEDAAGLVQDLDWNPEGEKWTDHGDVWLTSVRDLSTLTWTIDKTQVTKVWVRSTNWGAPDPNNDYLHFSRLVITAIPEPATMALFGLGLLTLLGLRRKK